MKDRNKNFFTFSKRQTTKYNYINHFFYIFIADSKIYTYLCTQNIKRKYIILL